VKGGAKKRKKRKATGKKRKKATGGKKKSVKDYEKIAAKMGIPLTKGGHKKTKEQLQRAISYRKTGRKRR